MSEVAYTDEFEAWWDSLDEADQDAVQFSVSLLRQFGVTLGHPHSSAIKDSKHPLRELRCQSSGRPTHRPTLSDGVCGRKPVDSTMAHAVKVRGRLSDPRHIELDEPVNNITGPVDVVVQEAEAPAAAAMPRGFLGLCAGSRRLRARR